MTSPVEQFEGTCPKCGHEQIVNYRASWNEGISGSVPEGFNEHTCERCGATFHAGDALIVESPFMATADDFTVVDDDRDAPAGER